MLTAPHPIIIEQLFYGRYDAKSSHVASYGSSTGLFEAHPSSKPGRSSRLEARFASTGLSANWRRTSARTKLSIISVFGMAMSSAPALLELISQARPSLGCRCAPRRSTWRGPRWHCRSPLSAPSTPAGGSLLKADAKGFRSRAAHVHTLLHGLLSLDRRITCPAHPSNTCSI